MKAIFQNAKKNYKKLAVILGLLLLVYVLFGGVRFIFGTIALITIGAFSTFYQYWLKSPIQFELVKLVVVVAAVVYGPVAAILIGIIASFIGKIMTSRLEADFIGSIAAIIIISILASAFATTDIVFLGIALVIVYHIIIFPIALMMGGNIGYGAIYTGSNIIFNIFVFNLLARPLLFVVQNFFK